MCIRDRLHLGLHSSLSIRAHQDAEIVNAHLLHLIEFPTETFDVYKRQVDAVKNMGIGTNFGNCTDVVAMWMNMNSNSVTDFEKAWEMCIRDRVMKILLRYLIHRKRFMLS